MKLYFAPGACSLSPHIALREAGIPFDLDQTDIRQKKTKDGGDFRAINPKGQVPTLGLDNGQVLTEGSAMVQYIADQKPEKKLAPANGTFERVRLQEWLNYIATEIHKGIGALFNPKATDEWKAAHRETLVPKLEYLAKSLEGKQYLMGDQFTVADGYLFTVLRWTKPTNVDISKWPVLGAYMDRVAARPGVHAALEAEGLLK